MQRRKFLAAGTAASLLLPAAAGAATSPSRGRIKVLDSYLTNAEHFPSARWPNRGARLSLRRDRSRAFDRLAVLVIGTEGEPIGYLPPASSGLLAALMDHGIEADAEAESNGSLSVFVATA